MAERRQVNIYLNGREINNTLKSIAAEKRKVANQLNLMVIGTEEYEAKVAELRQLNGVIKQHYDGLRTTENVWSKLKAGASAFVGVAAAALSVDAIVSYGKKLFDLGSQMDLLNKKAATVFGEALPAITREAEANAAAMGLTTSQYINAAAAIGDLLIPMGFARTEAANISAELVNLSGALSEWTGGQISAQEVSEKLSKALLGEREELKALGISISQADVDARVAAEGFGELTGELLQQAEAQATLNLILEKSVDAQNAYIQNSDNLVRKQAEIRARFQEIQERLATALIPVFERLVSAADAVSKVITTVIGGLTGTAESSNRASAAVANLQGQFNLEIETLKRGNLSTDNRRKLIEQINQKYAEYLPKLIQETDSLNDLTAAQSAANKAFTERITLLAFQERFEELTRKLVDAKKQELELELQLTAAQDNFNRSAKQSIDLVYGEAGERNIRQAQTQLDILNKSRDAVAQNASEQRRLQAELEKSKNLARELGINLLGPTASPTGGGRPQGPANPTGPTPPSGRPRAASAATSATPAAPGVPIGLAFDRLGGEGIPQESTEIPAIYEQREILLDNHQQKMLQLQQDFEETKSKIIDAANRHNVDMAKAHYQELITEWEGASEVFNQIGTALSDLMFLFAGESKTYLQFQRGLAFAQIAFDTAKAISAMTAKGALSGLTPIDAAIKIATGIATVVANIAKAKALLSTPIPDVPQRYTGGYFNATGALDGRNYRARYIGRPQTGMLPGSPSLVLASEKGAEYFVSNKDLQNPVVMNYVRAIENIRSARVGQFAEGGSTAPLPATVASTQPDLVVPLLQEISGKLDYIYARVDDQTIVDIQRRFNKLQDVAGGALL